MILSKTLHLQEQPLHLLTIWLHDSNSQYNCYVHIQNQGLQGVESAEKVSLSLYMYFRRPHLESAHV